MRSPLSPNRLFRALSREGMSISHDGPVYTVRLPSDPDAPPAEILLPSELPLELKAVKQLMDVAAVQHPDGGRVCRVCATPDFHPGDAGVAIGTVVEAQDVLIPQAVGSDIGCGMRIHTTDLTEDQFLSKKTVFVERMKGDYLLGTRDVVMTSHAMKAMFHSGVPAWIQAFKQNPLGRIAQGDMVQMEVESSKVLFDGSLEGDVGWAPEKLVPDSGLVRDDGLATVGRGNHFVEVQRVEEVMDRRGAYQFGVRKGQIVFMIHSGSRDVGHYVGGRWRDKVREAWPKGHKHPLSGIFPLSWGSTPDLCRDYLRAENTASNYAFVNRLLLAELLRIRLREVYGQSVEAPLIADVPHNYTSPAGTSYITRKGACPAYAEMPVIIPGSMGTSSYLCLGRGNDRWLNSASHGAGRAVSRGEMGRTVRNEAHAQALGLSHVDCITLREERRVEEAPAAYKDISTVVGAQVQEGIIGLVARMKPLLTFKA